MLTHGNLLRREGGGVQACHIDERDAILGVLPLFHALAQVANLLLPLTKGARVVYLETVNSTEMMRAFTERRITAFCVVPQFYYLLHQRIMERVAASPVPGAGAVPGAARAQHAAAPARSASTPAALLFQPGPPGPGRPHAHPGLRRLALRSAESAAISTGWASTSCRPTA